MKKNANDFFSKYIAEIMNLEVLSPEKTLELYNAYKNGNGMARETIIKHNMRLVVKCANNFKDYNVTLQDLVSAGAEGLTKAFGNWDPEKSQFNSYAGWWILKSMRELCDDNHIVHTKAYYRMNEEERANNITGSSLDEKRNGDGEDDGVSIGDTIADERDNPYETAEKSDLMKAAMTAINQMDEKHKFVVLNYCGLGGEKGNERLTLMQLAEKLDCTHQRAQQIKDEAIAKIREYLAC